MDRQMGMESKVITITPSMAQDMLDRNMKNNRKLNHNTIRRYARIMKAGGWNLTHQGIAFDEKGELIDGQHRLHAIIMANEPIQMMVTYNVQHEDGAAFTIDMGTKRTTQNVIQISGIEDDVYSRMAPYAAGYIRYKKSINSGSPDPVEIIAYIDRHYEVFSDVMNILGNGARNRNGSGGTKIHSIVIVAIIAAYNRGEDIDALRKFVQVYRTNNVEGCENYNPRHCLNLRDYVRTHKNCHETYIRCECAIYSFCHGQHTMPIVENRYPYMPALDA